MKILHIVPTYLPAYRYGGPIKSVHELNKWLVKNGAEVTVYTTNTSIENEVEVGKEVIIDGVKVHYFPTSFPRGWYYSRDLRSAISQNLKDFDLVHITSVFLFASYWGAKYAKEAGVPYIISPRGSLVPDLIRANSSLKKKLYINLFEKKNLAGAAAVHFTTELEKEEYSKLGLPLKKAIILPNGVEIHKNIKSQDRKNNFKQKFNLPDDAKIILSLGRLNWKKGFDTLIPAFARIIEQESKVVLVIAGGDENGYKGEIQKLITNNQLPITSFVFTGELQGEEKDAAFASADIFVMPSISENFGISAVEAMSFGVPAIVTDGVGIALDIKEAKAGIVIEKNVEQLVKALSGLLGDESLRSALGERGRKLAEEKYSWPEIAKKWIAAYNELV